MILTEGITKPPIRVSDLEVVELNFRGEFPQMYERDGSPSVYL